MKIFYDSLKNIAIIVLIAYPLTKQPSFKRSIIMKTKTKDIVILIILFGSLSILGNVLSSVTSYGILIDSRIVAPVVGGIVAGPFVGFMSGLAGGIYRYTLGGYSVLPDLVANVLSGLLGGYIHQFHSQKRLNPFVAFAIGLSAGLFHAGLVLVLTQPPSIGRFLVKSVGFTVIAINALGVSLFVMIVQDVQYSRYLVGANYAEKALEIARLTLPVMKNGFNPQTAEKLVKIIHDTINFEAVGIIENNKMIAFQGNDEKCDMIKKSVENGFFKKALENEMVMVANTKVDIGCCIEKCPYCAALEAPIINDEETLGRIRFYKREGKITISDVKLMAGITNLLNLQIKNYYLDERTKLLESAEFNVLRAQINPHFLFNAMSVIKVLIRTKPSVAQELVVNLSSYLRRNLKNKQDLVPLAEEIRGVELYLSIQKARYGDRLDINMDIDDDCLRTKIPTFIVQILVENSMNHGFTDTKGNILLTVKAYSKNHFLVLSVQDNGSGVPEEIIKAVGNMEDDSNIGIGLINIKKRLKSFYGSHGELNIENNAIGALVTVKIPI